MKNTFTVTTNSNQMDSIANITKDFLKSFEPTLTGRLVIVSNETKASTQLHIEHNADIKLDNRNAVLLKVPYYNGKNITPEQWFLHLTGIAFELMTGERSYSGLSTHKFNKKYATYMADKGFICEKLENTGFSGFKGKKHVEACESLKTALKAVKWLNLKAIEKEKKAKKVVEKSPIEKAIKLLEGLEKPSKEVADALALLKKSMPKSETKE